MTPAPVGVYPPDMPTLSASARQLIDSGRLAHFVTIGADDSPQVALVWVKMSGDDIVAAHLDPNQQKLRNIRRDHRVAISIESDVVNAHGLQEYLVVYGTSTLSEGGAAELLQELAHTYLGKDVKFPPMDNPPPGVVNRVSITGISGVGDWQA